MPSTSHPTEPLKRSAVFARPVYANLPTLPIIIIIARPLYGLSSAVITRYQPDSDITTNTAQS